MFRASVRVMGYSAPVGFKVYRKNQEKSPFPEHPLLSLTISQVLFIH